MGGDTVANMHTLAIGTTNPGKVAAVERALKSYPVLSNHFTIAPHKVPSGVSDQVRPVPCLRNVLPALHSKRHGEKICSPPKSAVSFCMVYMQGAASS